MIIYHGKIIFITMAAKNVTKIYNDNFIINVSSLARPISYPYILSSPPVFSGVRDTRSLVLYVCFVDRCLSFCTFSFGHCVVCLSSIDGFQLHLLYLVKLYSFQWLQKMSPRYIMIISSSMFHL
jgi:hypothetical protein